MRTRKNVKALTETEKSNFVNAVLALKKRPSNLHPETTGFSRYDDYVEVHREATQAHGGPAFLPWHRQFILQFENDLASIDASVSLPYWDWTDSSDAASPLHADFLGGNGGGTDQIVTNGPFAGDRWKLNIREDPGDSALLQRDIGADSTAAAPPTLSLQNAVLNIATYDCAPWKGVADTFRWQCETTLHNQMQRFIGGTMDTTTAPNDPLFFLQVANIDRLYAVWQGLHQASAHYLPVTGTPGHNLNDPLVFSAAGRDAFEATATPAIIVNHHTLGYRYDTEAQTSLGALKIPAAHLQVLYGIISEAAGVAITPTGNTIQVPGGLIPLGPGDLWTQLSPAARDMLIGSAVNELAAQIGNPNTRHLVQTAVAGLAGSKVRSASP